MTQNRQKKTARHTATYRTRYNKSTNDKKKRRKYRLKATQLSKKKGTTKKNGGKHSDVFLLKKREKETRKKGDQQTDVRAICDMYKKKCRGIYMFFFHKTGERDRKKKK